MLAARTIQEMNPGAYCYLKPGNTLIRFIGALILSLALGGCGTPEAWTDVRGTHSVSAIGNEKVAQSVLLDMARFADVANEMFPLDHSVEAAQGE